MYLLNHSGIKPYMCAEMRCKLLPFPVSAFPFLFHSYSNLECVGPSLDNLYLVFPQSGVKFDRIFTLSPSHSPETNISV